MEASFGSFRRLGSKLEPRAVLSGDFNDYSVRSLLKAPDSKIPGIRHSLLPNTPKK